MKHIFITFLCILAAVGQLMAAGTKTSRVYGVRVYNDANDETQALVSFDIDNPAKIDVEAEFPDYNILAGAADGSTYYLIHSNDGLMADKLLSYNLSTRTLSEVKTFDWKHDVIGNIIMTDMTFDKSTGNLYAVGFDLSEGEIVDDEINAPFGLYTINPATGESAAVGTQETAAIMTLAANDYELWGIDSNGNVWIISKYSGRLDDRIATTDVIPTGAQSMTYDFGGGRFVWAAFSTRNNNPLSELRSFALNDEWEVIFESPLAIAGNSELIGLYVDNNPIDRNAPMSPAGLSVVAGARGAATAAVSCTAPGQTLGGGALQAMTLTLYRDDKAVASKQSVAPGAEVTFNDSGVPAGMHIYSVSATAAGLEGPQAYANAVFVGVDAPGAPASVVASRVAGDTSFGVSITWTKPANGANGGWFDDSALKYCVTRYPDGVVITPSTDALTVTDNTITDLRGYSYGVKALTADGFGTEGRSNIVVSGPALNPPYAMNLNDTADSDLWTAIDADGDGYDWYVYRNGWAGTMEAFFRYNPENILDPNGEANDWLVSPAFHLEADKYYAVSYEVRLLGSLFPANTCLAIGNAPDTEAMTRVLETNQNEVVDIEWVRHAVPFTVDNTGDYHFGYQVANLVPVQLYHFNLIEIPEVNLAATEVKTVATANVGTPVEVSVSVANQGYLDVDSYGIELLDADDNLLTYIAVDTPVMAQTEQTVVFNWTPAAEGKQSVKARVIYKDDADEADNTTSAVSLTVFPEGRTIEIADGKMASGYVPVFTKHNFSASQTIYSAGDVDDATPGTIKAISWQVYGFMSSQPIDAEFEIWMANTDRTSFDNDNTPVSQSEFTKVYQGKFTLDRTLESIDVPLNQPFVYNGKNLCVQVRHSSDATASLAFKARYVNTDPAWSIVTFSDDKQVDFSGDVTAYRDRPNITLLMANDEASVGNLTAHTTLDINYDRLSAILTVSGDFAACRVYSPAGQLLGSLDNGTSHSLSAYPAGLLLLEFTMPDGSTILRKVVR